MKRSRIGYLCVTIVLVGITYASTSCADGLSGVYIGGSYGRAENLYDTRFVDGQYQNAATGAGETLKFTSSSVQRWSNAWWANAGYMPSSYFGIDAAFIHLGELTHRASGEVKNLLGMEPFIDSATVTSHGPALSLRLRLPLSDSFAVDMRVGDYYGKTSLTVASYFRSKLTQTPFTHSGSSFLASVGGGYSFAGHWSLRLDYLRVNDAGNSGDVGTYSVNMAAAGVSFTF
jgi:hypothetical protein